MSEHYTKDAILQMIESSPYKVRHPYFDDARWTEEDYLHSFDKTKYYVSVPYYEDGAWIVEVGKKSLC
jgi:hypothetical protein